MYNVPKALRFIQHTVETDPKFQNKVRCEAYEH